MTEPERPTMIWEGQEVPVNDEIFAALMERLSAQKESE